MALFGRKKTEKKETAAAKPVAVKGASVGRDLSHVLKHARITEKATDSAANNVYVFNIAASATKRDIMQAVKASYGVEPRKVAIVNIPSKVKRNMRTGRSGVKQGGKKAYVYLKSGETITLA